MGLAMGLRVLVVLALVGGVHVYWVTRLFYPLTDSALLRGVFWGVAGCSIVIHPIAFLARARALRDGVVRSLAWSSYLAMGAFALTLSWLVVRDLLWGLVFGIGEAWRVTGGHRWGGDVGIRDAWLAGSSVGVLGLSFVCGLVGFVEAWRTPRVKEVSVPIRGLSSSLAGFRVVQLSDIHIGPTLRRKFLGRVVEVVNQLAPDVVAITGDLVDGSVQQLSSHVEPLADLRPRYHTFFVTGNHEYYAGALPWVAFLRALGVVVLENEHRVLEHEGASLVIAGVCDYNAAAFVEAHAHDPAAAVAGAPAGALQILLAHQPRSALSAQDCGIHLQLSGHTHGGQFVPWNLFVPLQQPFVAGLHRLGDMWVYTSRGTGHWGPPLRLLAPAEISVITLVPENS